MKQAQFLFDFGSANSYLAYKVLPGIEQRTGVTFEYIPILLGGLFKLTNNQSPMMAFASVKNKIPYQMLEISRFTAKHGLTKFAINPYFPLNTMQMMRASIAAQELNVFAPYVEVMMSAMWERGLKLSDPDVFKAVLEDVDLPADALIAKSLEQPVKDKLVANTQSAFERGAFGAPTFFIGDEIYFGKDTLRDVEEEILR